MKVKRGQTEPYTTQKKQENKKKIIAYYYSLSEKTKNHV